MQDPAGGSALALRWFSAGLGDTRVALRNAWPALREAKP